MKGIPAQYDTSTVLSFLQNILEIEGEKSDIELGSLALSPHSPVEKVATLSSTQIAKALGPGDRWHKLLPRNRHQNDDLRKECLTLDTHFHDFTALSAPAQDHDIE